jgi:hypothetical protein
MQSRRVDVEFEYPPWTNSLACREQIGRAAHSVGCRVGTVMYTMGHAGMRKLGHHYHDKLAMSLSFQAGNSRSEKSGNFYVIERLCSVNLKASC